MSDQDVDFFYGYKQNEGVPRFICGKETIMMSYAFDVVSQGELLVDFTPYGLSDQGNVLLETNPGGGPCNVLAMVAKLSGRSAFVGKVGDDFYGHFLSNRVSSQEIDVSGVVYDAHAFTTLAFVHLNEEGERHFSFARKPGADSLLTQSDIPVHVLDAAKIFHYSSVALSVEPARSAMKFSVEHTCEKGKLLSFDPNYRPLLWSSEQEAKEQIRYGFSHCNILKIAEDEIVFMTGLTDVRMAVDKISTDYPNIAIIFATRGKKGCLTYAKNADVPIWIQTDTFTQVKTIDTTGAGDIFIGYCLYVIAKRMSLNFSKAELQEMVVHANAAASLITTRKGALCAVPTREEIDRLADEQSNAFSTEKEIGEATV